MCSLAGYHITRWISIPSCILSGAAVSIVGLVLFISNILYLNVTNLFCSIEVWDIH